MNSPFFSLYITVLQVDNNYSSHDNVTNYILMYSISHKYCNWCVYGFYVSKACDSKQNSQFITAELSLP